MKDGNWVEDKIGQDLAANRPRPKQTTTSELRSNYIDPADMPQKQSSEATYVDTQSRKGLNRDVLFNHGPDIFGEQAKVPNSSAGKELLRVRKNNLDKEQYQVGGSQCLPIPPICATRLTFRMFPCPLSLSRLQTPLAVPPPLADKQQAQRSSLCQHADPRGRVSRTRTGEARGDARLPPKLNIFARGAPRKVSSLPGGWPSARQSRCCW